jgi:hypothetical protein
VLPSISGRAPRSVGGLKTRTNGFERYLPKNGIDLPVAPPAEAKPHTPPARSTLNTTKKIALIRSLFRGCEDV